MTEPVLHLELIMRRPDPTRPPETCGYLCLRNEQHYVAQSPEFWSALEAALARPRVWWRGDPQPEGVIRLLDPRRLPIVLCGDGRWRRPDSKDPGVVWDTMLDVFGLVIEAPDGEDPGELQALSDVDQTIADGVAKAMQRSEEARQRFNEAVG